MENVSVSVIMSVYKEPAKWLEASVNSILQQSFRDFEFIIVNDNPGEAFPKDKLESFRLTDSRIRVLDNDMNIGLTKSLNCALEHAKGKYIARMDADDLAMPNRLQKQFDFLEQNPEYIACGSSVDIINEDGTTTSHLKKPVENEVIQSFLFFENPMIHPTLFFRKEFNLSYNTKFRYSQDFDFVSQLASYGKLYNDPEVLLLYRTSQIQITHTKIKEQNQYASEIRNENISKYLSKHYNLRCSSQNIKEVKSFADLFGKLANENKNDILNLSAIHYSLVFYADLNKSTRFILTTKNLSRIKLQPKYRNRYILGIVKTFRDQN